MRWQFPVGALAVSALTIALLQPAAAFATDESGTNDVAVAIDLTNLATFHDENGQPITVVTDETNADGLRVVTGSTTDRVPVLVNVYSAPSGTQPGPADSDPGDGLSDGTDAPDDETGASADDAAPDAAVDIAHHPGQADLSPSVVIATTPTNMTVAWVAPAGATTFTLAVDGQAQPSSSIPNTVVRLLEPATSYDVTVTSVTPGSTADAAVLNADGTTPGTEPTEPPTDDPTPTPDPEPTSTPTPTDDPTVDPTTNPTATG